MRVSEVVAHGAIEASCRARYHPDCSNGLRCYRHGLNGLVGWVFRVNRIDRVDHGLRYEDRRGLREDLEYVMIDGDQGPELFVYGVHGGLLV